MNMTQREVMILSGANIAPLTASEIALKRLADGMKHAEKGAKGKAVADIAPGAKTAVIAETVNALLHSLREAGIIEE